MGKCYFLERILKDTYDQLAKLGASILARDIRNDDLETPIL